MGVHSRHMGFFRVIHRKHFDSERDGSGFASTALNLRSGEPFSVVDHDCALAESGGICSHVLRYYRDQTGEPAIYWAILDEHIPAECRATPETTPTGDECHRNLHGWGRNTIRGVFKRLSLGDLTVCASEGERPLERSDLD